MLPTVEESKQIISQNAIEVAKAVLAKRNISFKFIENQKDFEEIILGKCQSLEESENDVPYEYLIIKTACVFQALPVLTDEQILTNCKHLCEVGDIFFYDEGRPDLALQCFQLACGYKLDFEEALWGVLTVCLQSNVPTEIALPYSIVLADVNPKRDEVNYVLKRIRQENPLYFKNERNDSVGSNRTSWFTAGGNERRTGYCVSNLKPPLKLKWAFKDSNNIFSGIVAADDIVVFGDVEGKVFALDIETGKKIWQKQLNGKHFGTPTIDGDIVIIGLSNYAFCFDLKTGETIWSFTEEATDPDDISNYSFASFGCPLALDGKVIFCDDRLAIFETQTGKQLLKQFGSIYSPTIGPCVVNGEIYFPRRKSILCYPFDSKKLEELSLYLDGKITAGPVVADSKLIVGTSALTLDCIDIITDRIVWSFPIESASYSSSSYIESMPAVYENNVVFGAPDGYVYNVDLDSGLKLWKTNLGFEIERAGVISNDQVFILSGDCTLYVLDLEDGQIKWQKRLLEKKGAKGSLAIYKDCLLVGLDGVYCFTNA